LNNKIKYTSLLCMLLFALVCNAFIVNYLNFRAFYPNKKTVSNSVTKQTKNVDNNIGDTTKTSINAVIDTTKADTLLFKSETIKISADTTKISKDAIESDVKYSADDSVRFEVDSQMVYLYGKAKVIYTEVELKADYIELSLRKNIVYAIGVSDSSGKIVGSPEFKDGDQEFKSDKITYNFETKKGKIINVHTTQDEGYLYGDKVKKDSSDNIYMLHGTYTTCNLEHPHFWFDIYKVKVIKDDKIVTGPANLKIAGVPTPLALPFGFFPNKKGRANGIIIPRPFDSEAWGFGLEEGGYYMGINDNMDLTLTGDIFSRGSFKINAATNYVKRYKYSGSFSVRYTSNKSGEKGFPDYNVAKDMRVYWSHNQDPKARPNSRFTAKVDAGKTNAKAQREINLNIQNTLASSIRYDKIFAGTPFSMAIAANHSQNTATKIVEITAPDILLNMQSINPLGTNFTQGKAKWISDLRLNYNTNIQNKIRGFEEQIFSSKQKNLDSVFAEMRNGMTHNASLATNVKALKYLIVTPSVTYSELWYLQTKTKSWDAVNDTIATTLNRNFSRANNVGLSASLRTVLYGVYLFKHGNLKGFRHTIQPNISYNYNPGITKNQTYYNPDLQKTIEYSKYEGGIIGQPSTSKSSFVNMGLNNILGIKYKPRKDTLGNFTKVNILDNFGASTSYNVLADSMNWSPINVNARVIILNNFNVSYDLSYNLYALNNNTGIVTKQYMRDVTGKFARLTSSNFSIQYSLRSKNTKAIITDSKTASQAEIDEINRNRDQYIDFNLPWQISFIYTLSYNKAALVSSYGNHILRVNGDLSLTRKWKITFSSGWDFTAKDIVLPTINVYRDLHCWEMSFNVIPYGPSKQYSLNINVKASVLQDMKLSRRRSWYDLR